SQYYCHTFLSAQPDLNWRHPEVRTAIYDIMRFWLRRGVDGFRVDVIWHLIKDDQFRDNPFNPAFHAGEPPHHALVPLYTTDRPGVASRVGLHQVRVAAMLLLTLRGTPTIYYGDEIGMEDAALRPDQVRDPFEKNVPGRGLGRDRCRTPMQWDGTTGAGFSAAEPWLPVADSLDRKSVV